MSSNIEILDPFNRINPGPFISSYSEWIFFTLLLFFFWAVVGISLKKRFEESRYLRVLITSTALMLAVATYYSIFKGWLHLSLQGLGLFGAILLLVVVFFIILGLMRGYGMHLSNALPIGLILFYISLWAVSPNILHTLGKIFPLGNTIFLLLFIVSFFKVIWSFFHISQQSLLGTAKDLKKTRFTTTDDVEIDREISKDKQEGKLLKKKTMKLTKVAVNTLEDIENYLNKMTKIIKEKGKKIDRQEIEELSKILGVISKKESILTRGLELITRHVHTYQSKHRKDISELSKRLSETKNKKQQKLIQNELTYQKRMIQALVFMERYESKINEFCKFFNNRISMAMQKIKNHYPVDAQAYLEEAHKSLDEMKHVYETQKSIEKYLLKLNKKTISGLKKEKDQ